MQRPILLAVICCSSIATPASAGQGSAGASGPCKQVIGPTDAAGNPIGFTCENVGNNALLIWNASKIDANVTVNGTFRTVNFSPGNMSIEGSFKSGGDIAFVGGAITVTKKGSITGANVVLAGASTTPSEIKNTLLGAPESVESSATFDVIVDAGGKVKATSGNVVLAGGLIANAGAITAKNGQAILKSGSTLNIGWSDATWVAGFHTSNTDHHLQNTGSIVAKDIILEAHRSSNLVAITNTGRLSAANAITLITGLPGQILPDGTYKPNTSGIKNKNGTIYAGSVTIRPYYREPIGNPPSTDRTFDTKNSPDDRARLEADINGGRVFGPTDANTPANDPGVINKSTSGTFSPTASNVVIPQLAVSVSHMNAAQARSTTVAQDATKPETVRGSSNKITAPAKPRPKSKPVLVRGAFFDTKISATLTAAKR